MIERTIIVILATVAIIFVPYWIGRFVMDVWFDTKDTILSWVAGTVIIMIVSFFLATAIPYVIN